jgi:hypothetical protein
MGYAIIFFANVAISNPSELIEHRRCRLVFLIDQRLYEGTIPMPETPTTASKPILYVKWVIISIS